MSTSETKLKTKSTKYQKKEKKDYVKWIEEHHDDILKQPSSERAEYVFNNMSKEISTKMTLKAVYQLLYRKKLIEHKKLTEEKKKENVEMIHPEMVGETFMKGNEDAGITEYDDYDKPEHWEDIKTKRIGTDVSFILETSTGFVIEHLLHYITQTSILTCLLVPNSNNFDEEDKPTIEKIINVFMTLTSTVEDLKEVLKDLQHKKIDFSQCEDVIVKFKKDCVDAYLAKDIKK